MFGRKGIAGLDKIVMALVLVTIVLGVGLMVLTEFQNAMTSGSSAYNATGTLIEKLGGMPTWIGILIIVIMAGYVIRSLGVFGGGK